MTNHTSKKSQRVRFEEVTPTNEIVAYFDVPLPSLLADTGLPIWLGYDDLDYIQFAYINLPSGNTVVLGQYANAPEIGVDLYVDFNPKHKSSTIAANIPALVVETLRYLAISREAAVWFHPDYETEIGCLYSEHSEIEPIGKLELGSLPSNEEREPIDCLYYALDIYTREKLPEYWAMLQHNLGLAYYDRSKGEPLENLQESIGCFYNSLEIFTRDNFPEKWQINEEYLNPSVAILEMETPDLISDILDRPRGCRNLKYVNLSLSDLSEANLMRANLMCANLTDTDLTGANLMCANLSDVDLTGADLTGANLTGAYVCNADLNCVTLSDTTNFNNTQFIGYNYGISEQMRQDLIARGAIFEDCPSDGSESRTLVPR